MSHQPQNTAKLVAEEIRESLTVGVNPEKMVLKGHSWAQMTADAEEEEEQERLTEEQERIKNVIVERRVLYSIGEYELEEGEILE